MISTFDGAGRHARRRRHPLGHAPRTSWTRSCARVRAGGPRRRPGRRRGAAGRGLRRTTTTGPRDPAPTGVEVFERVRARAGCGVRRWRRPRPAAVRLRRAPARRSTFLGTSTGLRRRFDQPDGRVELNGKSARPAPLGLGRRAHQRLRRRRLGASDRRPATAASSWARNRDRPAGRALRDDPAADRRRRPDDLRLLDRRPRATPRRAATSSPAATAATRIGERLAAAAADAALGPARSRACECPPFEIATASDGGLQSVFDNGAPSPAVDWIARRRARPTSSAPARGPPAPARSAAAVRRQPDPGRAAATADARRRWSPSTERGLLLTCLWYIREVDPQTLLLTGLTRDGVYLVEDGAGARRGEQLPVQRVARSTCSAAPPRSGRSEPTLSREWSDYFTPHRDAAAAGPRLQHVDGQPGDLGAEVERP